MQKVREETNAKPGSPEAYVRFLAYFAHHSDSIWYFTGASYRSSLHQKMFKTTEEAQNAGYCSAITQ